MDVEIWRSCTALSGQEKNFTPDYRRISADNGMDHRWADYRHLNVHLIVIHGPGHRPHVEEMEPALASMAQIFAQPTVKILLHFTSVYVEDESLLDISEDGDVDASVPSSFPHLFAETAHVQVDDAVQIFVLRSSLGNGYAGYNFISGGRTPATFPRPGNRQAGPVVFLEEASLFSSLYEPRDEARWRNVGHTMAHEVGHALGLLHTSFDQLIETPECDSSTTTTYCGSDSYYDAGDKNVMFVMSFYDPEYVGQLTGEQGYVLRLNPLVYR